MSFNHLPIDVVINILRFDGRFRVRRGEIIDKLDTKKYKTVINFLLNKPLPCFKNNLIGQWEKCYEVCLSQRINILYNLKFNINNQIETIEIYLWKSNHPLNKLIYN